MTNIKSRLLEFYEHNETKIDVAFFLGGFIFDIFTLSDIDDPVAVFQQIVYLLIIGSILFFDFLASQDLFKPSSRVEKFWNYRQLVVHFLLGSLLSVYSLFFFKSASIFSSLIFIALMVGLMIANEIKHVQKSEVNLKIALFVICLFSFFSMLIPVLLGFVGIVPFTLSLIATGLVIVGIAKLLKKRVSDSNALLKSVISPAGLVLGLFFVFYWIGWIPPVPLSVQSMGVYHNIEKSEGKYILSHEKPSWKFWLKGDQDFYAEPQDKIFFFAEIFSPARFDDSVILHWYFKDPRTGWQSTDKIPMRITGGRKNGYRGFSMKQNYTAGEWRISVETTDGREIGRIYFDVFKVNAPNPARAFAKDIY